MQDEINEKVVALSIKGGKLTAATLQKAVKAMLAQMKKQHEKQPQGKQTLKQLAKQNAGLSNIEITEGNIKAFEHTAKKYGIDFALKKDAARQFQPYGYDRRADERSRLWASSHIRRRKISHYGERHKGFCHCRRAAGENKPVETY